MATNSLKFCLSKWLGTQVIKNDPIQERPLAHIYRLANPLTGLSAWMRLLGLPNSKLSVEVGMEAIQSKAGLKFSFPAQGEP